MGLIHLSTHQALITEISDELLYFSAVLEIPTEICMEDDHVFIVDISKYLRLGSYCDRLDTDVLISTNTFCEVLMDIKAGMPALEAYNKQGYTFNVSNLKE